MAHARAITEAQALVTAATEAGENLTFEAALGMVHRSGQAPSKLLLDVERNVPTFAGEAKESVSNFIFQLDRALSQHKITDEAEKLSVVVSRLKGRALVWYRQNGAVHATFARLTAALSERFTQSPESVRAALTRKSFDPAKETLKAFH